MREHVIRLHKGDDLKKSIIEFTQKENIKAGVILSGVGCCTHVHFRKAKATSEYYEENDFEIVSMTGTIADNGVHIHISFCDDDLRTIGGHLMDGCLIGSTCELVIGELEDYQFTRIFDDSTGYKELVATKKPD